MDHYYCEAEFSRAAMARFEYCIVATDSAKFGGGALVQVCPLDQVDLLVTDMLPGSELTLSLEAAWKSGLRTTPEWGSIRDARETENTMPYIVPYACAAVGYA